jgi:phosphomannomutase
MSLADEVRAWIADDVDPQAAAELRALLDGGDEAELADRFSAPLMFGTAGLRGPMRAGPNGMNRTVVRRSAAGLAAWLSAHGTPGGLVVVGYDARHGSSAFAMDSAAIFAAAGFDARLMPGPLPTPVLACAVQRFGAAAGVMVTASHNPSRDNGYKVYAADGAQLISPADREIEAAIRAVPCARAIRLSEQDVSILDGSVVADYVAAVADLVRPGPRELSVVYTALHGVGSELLHKVFAAAGFATPIAVAQQDQPDPDFPTLAYPNPEEPGALDLALALARDEHADIVIANDPDADRCAVALPLANGSWRTLRGDEVGVLLADALLAKGIRGTYATTIVSSSMLAAMARRHRVGYAETLTGFKWISRAAPDLVFGYEEALGYAVAPDLVRDKDGISAALLIAEFAASLKAAGSSLPQRLDELATEYGRYTTDQLSVRVDDLAVIAAMMRRLRGNPPRELLGFAIHLTDLWPDADVVRLSWPGGRVVVRPSGTEPKLKAYLEVIDPQGSAERTAELLARLRGEVSSLLFA